MSERLYLGVDCSAYTTSLALVDEQEELIWERRRLLPVPEGGLGLRQSEAVFAHIRGLPELWEEGAVRLEDAPLGAVAAAVRPRPRPDSYMPVFRVSQAAGELIARTLALSFFPYSHQEGHLSAGLWSAGLPPGRYLAVHLSGGTTELLGVEETAGGLLAITALGGGADLHAGQFVDRIGLALGFAFPAGPALEHCARRGETGAIRLPVAVQGTSISFSGPASEAQRLLERGCNGCDLARAVELCIADSLAAALRAVEDSGSYEGILIVGGVAANLFIRERLRRGLSEKPLYFAAPEFAGDNAAGLAVLARRRAGALKPTRKMNCEKEINQNMAN